MKDLVQVGLKSHKGSRIASFDFTYVMKLLEQLYLLHDRTESLSTPGNQTLASNLTLHLGIDGKKNGREGTPV